MDVNNQAAIQKIRVKSRVVPKDWRWISLSWTEKVQRQSNFLSEEIKLVGN